MVAESKVSDKYQVVIPKAVREELGLRRGFKVRWVTLSDGTVVLELANKQRVGWAKRMRGLGKEVWQGVDVNQYIDELREDWTKWEKEHDLI